MFSRFACLALSFILFHVTTVGSCGFSQPQVQSEEYELLNAQTFWDNRDFDWYTRNIPFFECPDADITTTYYYRWDLLTKHLTYGSPNSGYSFTEFIDRPFWSGAYGAISCPAGYQLYEARWLRSPRIAEDYSRYWFRTPGAQPRNYSTWLADSVWAVHQVHPNRDGLVDLLPDLIKNYEGWQQRHFVPEVGLFWQTGHDDGMEFNINSRQTQDILRGAPSYRPSFNAYMWADAQAIARVADLAGRSDVAMQYRAKADALKAKMLELMWDEQRQFFFPLLKNDEERDGFKQKALSKTYETGRYAGDTHGRELIGYVPWQFSLVQPNTKYDAAWPILMSRDGFFADFGPSTVERHDPMFLLQKSCCWWSGQSWPYATTQTLKAMANYLQQDGQAVSKEDYLRLLQIYARSHRKDGKPYLAEALHPDTGSFEGHDGYNHSEHYFHSGYCDLIITGLVGLMPRDDATMEVRPLAPKDWEYFALTNVPYRGHLVSIYWDKTASRYGFGPGLHIAVKNSVNGTTEVQHFDDLRPVVFKPAFPLPKIERTEQAGRGLHQVNFAVNNDGTYYPRTTASYTAPGTSLSKVNDGNYWYLRHPPNRWTCENSPNPSDWIEIDFGVTRTIHTVRAYVLSDKKRGDSSVRVPIAIHVDCWNGEDWAPTPGFVEKDPFAERDAVLESLGGRPIHLSLGRIETRKLRVTLKHPEDGRSGLTEIEAWGPAQLPLEPVPPPAGNLAFNDGSKDFPKATASYHDRFGGVPRSSIDGITNFLPTPMNRWTSYESPNKEDWLKIDFGKPTEFRHVELAIYDDRGGVQPPTEYSVEVWQDEKWQPVEEAKKTPDKPAGSAWNSIRFRPVTADKLRIVFNNHGQARSGVSEVMVWNE